MIIEIPNIGKLQVVPNNDDGTPSFHIALNGETIVHAEMNLAEETVQVFVWSADCFKDENSMNDFHMFTYPSKFRREA